VVAVIGCAAAFATFCLGLAAYTPKPDMLDMLSQVISRSPATQGHQDTVVRTAIGNVDIPLDKTWVISPAGKEEKKCVLDFEGFAQGLPRQEMTEVSEREEHG